MEAPPHLFKRRHFLHFENVNVTFVDNVLRTDHSFCQRLSRPQAHHVAGRITSMKNSCDTIGNRTRDLTAYGAVPHPIVPPGCLFYSSWRTKRLFPYAIPTCIYCVVRAVSLNIIQAVRFQVPRQYPLVLLTMLG